MENWNTCNRRCERGYNQRYFVKPTSGKTGPFTDFLTVCKSFPLLMSAIHNNCHERCLLTLNTYLLLFEKRTIAVETKSSLQEVGSIKLSLLILTLLDKILMEKSSIFFKPHLRILITLMTPLFRNKLIYRDSGIITMTTWKSERVHCIRFLF